MTTPTTEFNIKASSDEIVTLLEKGNANGALERWNELRTGQPLAIQEAFDRFIAIDGKEYINNLRLSPDLNAEARIAVMPMFDQIQSATNSPRMPDPFIMEGLPASLRRNRLDSKDPIAMERIAHIQATEGVSEAQLQSGLSEAQKKDIYLSILYTQGDQRIIGAYEKGDDVLLALRQDTPPSVNNGRGIPDDHLIVLNNKQDRNVVFFSNFNTEPSNQYNELYKGQEATTDQDKLNTSYRKPDGENVDNDGIRDPGKLATGVTYEFVPRGQGNYLNQPALMLRVPSDASIKSIERISSKNGSIVYTRENTSFLVHVSDANGMNTNSAGCQSLPKPDYPRLTPTIARVGSGKDKQPSIFYTLSATNKHPVIQYTQCLDEDVEKAIFLKYEALQNLRQEIAKLPDGEEKDTLLLQDKALEGDIEKLEATRKSLLTYEREQLNAEQRALDTNRDERLATLETGKSDIDKFLESVKNRESSEIIKANADKAGISIDLPDRYQATPLKLSSSSDLQKAQAILEDFGYLPHKINGEFNSDVKKGLIELYEDCIRLEPDEAKKAILVAQKETIEKMDFRLTPGTKNFSNPKTIDLARQIVISKEMMELVTEARLTQLGQQALETNQIEQLAITTRSAEISQALDENLMRTQDPLERRLAELSSALKSSEEALKPLDPDGTYRALHQLKVNCTESNVGDIYASLKEQGIDVPLKMSQVDLSHKYVSFKDGDSGDQVQKVKQFLFDHGCYGDKKLEDVAITGAWSKADGEATLAFQKQYRALQVSAGYPAKDLIGVDAGSIGLAGNQLQSLANTDPAQVLTRDQVIKVIDQNIQKVEGLAPLLDKHAEILQEKTVLENVKTSSNKAVVLPTDEINGVQTSGDKATESPKEGGTDGNTLARLQSLLACRGDEGALADVTQCIRNSETGANLYASVDAQNLLKVIDDVLTPNSDQKDVDVVSTASVSPVYNRSM